MSNSTAIAAVRSHHEELSTQLQGRVRQVMQDALVDDIGAAQRELVRWCRDELLPHAVAEERTLYDAAAGREPTRLLVRAMLDEHRSLEALVDAAARAQDIIEIVGAGASIQALFTVHLAKENDLLLPALDGAGLDIDALVSGMHEVLGGHGDPADAGSRG